MYGITLGTRSSIHICGGHWFTRLALSYGVDTSGMVTISIWELGTTSLGKMQMLTREAGQPCRVLGDAIVTPIWEVEPEVILELSFVRHQILRHAEPDHPESTHGDVMCGLTAAQEERLLMMALVVVVMRNLGMDHPPFPSADPVVPPFSQPRNTGYDGADPSGTHPGYTDDDNNDEETETESKGGEEYICGFYFLV
uniref:Uncharacterized protein n=1 Tax=Lactuca sativa TaxID=4236 RepID=A0A9R1XPK5_LACSA|nr:hypothetical protein LSAT_V11C300126580 [Lactuca sativa]